MALRFAARRNAQIAERISDPPARRIPTVTTAVIGVILLVHALVIVALALTASTTTFLALKTPSAWLSSAAAWPRWCSGSAASTRD